jgi:hypothetical protein
MNCIKCHLTQNARLSGASVHQNPTRGRREWLPDKWINRWLARAVVPVRRAGWLALTASAHDDELSGHSNRQEQEPTIASAVACVQSVGRIHRGNMHEDIPIWLHGQSWILLDHHCVKVSLASSCLRKRASLEYRNRSREGFSEQHKSRWIYSNFQSFGYQLPYNSIK